MLLLAGQAQAQVHGKNVVPAKIKFKSNGNRAVSIVGRWYALGGFRAGYAIPFFKSTQPLISSAVDQGMPQSYSLTPWVELHHKLGRIYTGVNLSFGLRYSYTRLRGEMNYTEGPVNDSWSFGVSPDYNVNPVLTTTRNYRLGTEVLAHKLAFGMGTRLAFSETFSMTLLAEAVGGRQTHRSWYKWINDRRLETQEGELYYQTDWLYGFGVSLAGAYRLPLPNPYLEIPIVVRMEGLNSTSHFSTSASKFSFGMYIETGLTIFIWQRFL